MEIYKKLLAIQQELKAPKAQYNAFGKYNYRSCEDILEAVKPLCAEQGVVLIVGDDIKFVEGRHYVHATAILINVDNPKEQISVSAFAREEDEKKGMDASQVTGATSSYARKYALNGMFDIDDNKDADASAPKKATATKKKPPASDGAPLSEEAKELIGKITKKAKAVNASGVDLEVIYGVVKEKCGTRKYNTVNDVEKLTAVLEAVSNLKGA